MSLAAATSPSPPPSSPATATTSDELRRLILSLSGNVNGSGPHLDQHNHYPRNLKTLHCRLLRLHHHHFLPLLLRLLISRNHLLISLRLFATIHLPDHFAVPFALKACGRLRNHHLGTQIHAQSNKRGLSSNIHVSTSLVALYSKCDCLHDAQKVFDEMGVKNAFSWTAIISGYIEAGRLRTAVNMFRNAVESDCLRPDSFTVVRVLGACARLGDLEAREWVRGVATKMGMRGNVFVATALVDLYVKAGRMERAREVFDGMVERDVVIWSAMVVGYASNGLPREALALFDRMLKAAVSPDCYTIVGVLSSCAWLGALDWGRWARLNILNLDRIFSYHLDYQDTIGMSFSVVHGPHVRELSREVAAREVERREVR